MAPGNPNMNQQAFSMFGGNSLGGSLQRGSQLAPERNQGIMQQLAMNLPPPTKAAMPAMLAARRKAAASMNPMTATQGAFGPGMDGRQGPGPTSSGKIKQPFNMKGLFNYLGSQ